MEVEDEYRVAGEIEPDSDSEDVDSESQLSQWLGELENYAKGLDDGETGTVRRRHKTVVTPKMAMESFRYSFCENQDVNFDAILGELTELESQLGTAQSKMTQYGADHCLAPSLIKDENRDSGNDLAQAELEALASEITLSLKYKNTRPMGELDYFHSHYPGDLGGYNDAMFDVGETDSAFSESASLPSSESFTSMVTVSSAADAAWAGDTGSSGSGSTITPQSTHSDVEQKAMLQAAKIRIALEKIKDAKIKKLFVRAFAHDGSSKSIMVDEKMTIGEIISVLADKNHMRLHAHLAVVEHMPELFMERILEDHDSLVEAMVMWTRDTQNRILFERRPQKNNLFLCPEKYLLVSSSSEAGASLDPKRRENLIQEFFCGSVTKVPPVEGVLYLKANGKKAWKKFYFVLRASGLYYNPKGKVSKALKDLTCLVQFDFVELYTGLNWKKKYHAPTDLCFALKHPQIQKNSKFIRYLCAENKAALDQWVMGIRIAKYGKQLLTNFQTLQHEMLTWDTRELRSSISDQTVAAEVLSELKHPDTNLQGSRLSVPELSAHHSIVTVKNSMLVKDTSDGNVEEVVCLELDENHLMPERRSSLTPGLSTPDAGKVPVKRVSFSNTHSVIHDGGAEVNVVRHRDSITSASTDSSEDSVSSGEGRMHVSHRSKLHPKLPVTTGTTRQISEMVQTSIDAGSSGSFDEYSDDWKPPVSSPIQKDRGLERRKSAPAFNTSDGSIGPRSRTNSNEDTPWSPTLQSPHSDSGRPVLRQQKGNYKSHSRGSSISSMDSADSYQGQLLSPTMPAEPFYGQTAEYDHSRFPLYETITPTCPPPAHIQTGISGTHNQTPTPLSTTRQAPPTAQKPGGKKTRPQSGPATGPVEKGHRRNASKTSLESVEEVTSCAEISSPTPGTPTGMFVSAPIPGTPTGMFVSAPIPGTPTGMFVSAPIPGTPTGMFASASIPGTPTGMFASAPIPGRTVMPPPPPCAEISNRTPGTPTGMFPCSPTPTRNMMPPPPPPPQQTHTDLPMSPGVRQYPPPPPQQTSIDLPSSPGVRQYPPPPPQQTSVDHPASPGIRHYHAIGQPTSLPPQQTSVDHPASPGIRQYPSLGQPTSQPNSPMAVLPYQQLNKRQDGSIGHDPIPVYPQTSSPPLVMPVTSPQVPMTGPSPRGLKVTIPLPRLSQPHSVLPSPPPLVPPTPRNLANPVKTHKKRPSGDNFVVSGNQMPRSSLDYPDIATTIKPAATRLSELPLPSCSLGAPMATQVQGPCAINNDDINYAPLPFMAELNKHMHQSLQQSSQPVQVCDNTHQTSQHYEYSQNVQRNNQNMDGRLPPETLPKPSDPRHTENNTNHSAYIKQPVNMCSSNSVVTTNKPCSQSDGKRNLPPPPPKRSHTTKLSSVSSQSSLTDVTNAQAGNVTDHIDPIYDNCEGIIDINDLPPPPPELLEGYHNQNGDSLPQTSKGRPPPPPPPRNKETQLSTSVV